MKCLFCQNETKLSFDGFSWYVKCEECGGSGPREKNEDEAKSRYKVNVELKPVELKSFDLKVISDVSEFDLEKAKEIIKKYYIENEFREIEFTKGDVTPDSILMKMKSMSFTFDYFPYGETLNGEIDITLYGTPSDYNYLSNKYMHKRSI